MDFIRRLLRKLGRLDPDNPLDRSIEVSTAGDSDSAELQLESVLVFHKFVFELSRPTDPIENARRILESDLGLAASSPSGSVLHASRFRHLEAAAFVADSLTTLAELVQRRGFKTILRVTLRHPFAGIAYLAKVRSVHRRGKRLHKDPNAQGQASVHATAEHGELDDTDSIRYHVAKTSSIVQLSTDQDQVMIASARFASEPWFRLELQPIFVKELDDEENALDVHLLIHRSGLAVLQIVEVRENLSLGNLQLATYSSVGRFTRTEFPTTAVAEYARSVGGKPALPDSSRFSSGIDWSSFEHAKDQPITLNEVAQLYLRAIARVCLHRAQQFPTATVLRHYPVVSVRHCAPNVDQEAVARILLTWTRGWTHLPTYYLKQNVDDREVVRHPTHRLWIEPSGALALFKPDREVDRTANEMLKRELKISSAIDMALVRQHVPELLTSRLTDSKPSLTELRRANLEILSNASELFGPVPFNFGVFNEGILRLERESSRADTVRELSEVATLSARVSEDLENARRSRRDALIQLNFILATILIGIPSIHSLVGAIGRATPSSDHYSRLRPVVRWTIQMCSDYSAEVTLTVSSIALVMLIGSWIHLRRRFATSLTLRELALGRPLRGRPYVWSEVVPEVGAAEFVDGK